MLKKRFGCLLTQLKHSEGGRLSSGISHQILQHYTTIKWMGRWGFCWTKTEVLLTQDPSLWWTQSRMRRLSHGEVWLTHCPQRATPSSDPKKQPEVHCCSSKMNQARPDAIRASCTRHKCLDNFPFWNATTDKNIKLFLQAWSHVSVLSNVQTVTHWFMAVVT